MILYLQANYDGTFAIAEKNNYKDEINCYDYYTLENNISGKTPIVEIAKMVIEKYNCRKLILDF